MQYLLLGTSTSDNKRVQIACVGDSITYGSGATDRNRTSYPPVLQELLGEESYQVHNFGLGSTTVIKSGDHPYWYTQEFNDSIALKPDIVIIQLGTNDAKEWNWNETSFVLDYIDLINVYKSLKEPSPIVYIAIPPPLYHKGHGIREDIINSIYPNVIPSISQSTEVLVIDIFNALGGSTLQKLSDFILTGQEIVWPHDGCHPNDFGYFDIANEISSCIFATNFHFY